VFGLAAVRAVGYINTLYLVLATYLLVLVVYAWRYRCGIKPVCIGVVLALVVAGVSPHSVQLIEIPPGWRLVESRESPMGHVIVREQLNPTTPAPFPLRLLQVNKHHRMGGMYGFADRRMGHMPLLLANGARRVLFLGVGTGGTVGCTRHYPLDSVDAVEISPEVVDVLHHFSATNEGVEHLDFVRIHKADARRFVRASRDRYDLIIGDLFHPGRDGAGMLFTIEHFETLRDHVAPGGIVAQWLSLEQYDKESLRLVVRTFLEVFPNTHAFLGNCTAMQPTLMLAGKVTGSPAGKAWIDLHWLLERFQAFEDRVPVLQDIEDFMSSYFSDHTRLKRFAGDGPVNRDLDPILIYRAPRSAYEKKLGTENLGLLMPFRRRWPPEMVRMGDDASRTDWLEGPAAKRWKAVGQYLNGDILMVEGSTAAVAAGVDAFIAAYKTDATFRAVNERLHMLSSRRGPHAGRILEVLGGGGGGGR
jgi:spermidine synthase